MNSLKKQSVLFCIFSLTGGGAEKLLIDILQRIDNSCFDVDLCVLTRRNGVYFNAVPDYVKCFIYEDINSFSSKNYDVEIAFLEGPPTRLVALHHSSAIKIAWVHTDMYINRWTKSYYQDVFEETLCYNMMDEIIFVSHTAMQQFDRLFPEVTTKKHVIYNLFDKKSVILKSKANIPHINHEKLTLCSIGRLVPVKGYIRLIPILKKLHDDGLDFQFWIIGDGFQRNEIQNLINESNLEKVVHLQGFQKNPYPWLKKSDIFVSVSYAEGLPLVIGEALCLGKPVLATRVSGSIEILGHGKYGMLVDSNDNSIYNGLKKMMSDKSLRTTYAKQAKIGSKTEIFNIQKNMTKIYKLLSHTTSTKPENFIVKHEATSENTAI